MKLHELIAERWSPREYISSPVSDSDLREIFSAALAAHSCFNEQPWRFLITLKDGSAKRLELESLLDDGNAFAKEAWVLGIALAKKTFTKTGALNRHHGYDLGSACQLASLRAQDLGLGMRFMAGFDRAKACQLVPSDFEPYSFFVIGHPKPGLIRPSRTRKDISEIVFKGDLERAYFSNSH